MLGNSLLNLFTKYENFCEVIMIHLEPITRKNYKYCLDLKLTPEQQDFLADNLYSLAQAYVFPTCEPYGIYDGKIMVGFLMFCLDPDDDENWIWRLMIDYRYQRRGYAYDAMKLIMEKTARETNKKRLLISYVPSNIAAEQLYYKLGFHPTGEYINGEIIMAYNYPEKE